MGVGNRILLALYTLVTLALTVLLAGVLLPLLPEREWANEIAYLTGRPEAYAGLLAYFLVGVHLFLCAFSARKGQGGAEICLVTGTAGRVHVSVAAVRSVVLRVAGDVPGVRDAQAQVLHSRVSGSEEDRLRVRVRLTLRSGVPVKETADQVSACIRQELAQVLGIEDVQAEISVAEISDERLPQRPRVS